MKKLILFAAFLLLSSFARSTSPVTDTMLVTGIVLDDSFSPIIGASVIQRNSENGTTTDVDGRFSLILSGKKELITYQGNNRSTVGYYILVSYLGYNPVQIGIPYSSSNNGNNADVIVILTPSS